MHLPSSRPPRVLIIQPQAIDGPAYLATWLRQAGIAFDLCQVERGDEVPIDAGGWAAVAVLGGSMSANDDLPFLQRTLALLHSAVALQRPVLGHCLGGQLLARALGASVTDNPEPEIGWSQIEPCAGPLAQEWLGGGGPLPMHLPVYQWHFQTFGLPPGAQLLARNAACAHQAFALGPHLGMQFHIEVDEEKLGRWFADAPPDGDPLLAHPGVQGAAAMRADTSRWLTSSQQTADRLYRRWWSQA